LAWMRCRCALTQLPLRPDTVKKYLRVAQMFTDHRGSGDIETLTSQEVTKWIRAMLDVGDIKNRTVKDRLASLKTIVNYAIEQSDPKLFGGVSPIRDIKPPRVLEKAAGHSTNSLDEARQLLTAAQAQS
jgi:site-specific recombinase XerC